METQRLTIRLPQHLVNAIDIFVKTGEFATRSEVIRRALNEYISNYSSAMLEKAEKIKKVQELKFTLESIEPYTKK